MTLMIALALSVSVISQTAVIPNIPGEIGTTVIVPVTVADWQDIVCFTLNIGFDPSKIDFMSSELWHPEMLINVTGGRIAIVWVTEVDSITHPYDIDGVLAHLYFNVRGESSLKFGRCEVIQDPYTPVDVTYTNGLIYQTKKKATKLR